MTNNTHKLSADVVVVGGGPAGMMAAGRAAERGARVVLVEKTYRVGSKLLITGGGRCNITNDAGQKDFTRAFGENGRFLYRALNVFSNRDLVDFFAARGVEMRTDPDGKIFPSNDSAAGILAVLRRYIDDHKVRLLHNSAVTDIFYGSGETLSAGGVTLADHSVVEAPKVILATGGLSYPATGSTGDGYALAKKCGHTIVPLRPALVPLESDEKFIRDLQGLTVKDIAISVIASGKAVETRHGDILFTHFGVSGPAVLILSGTAVDALAVGSRVELSLRLRTVEDLQVFDRILQKEFETSGAKTFSGYLKEILPASLVPVFMSRCAVPADKRCSMIGREERKRIAALFVDFRIHITRPRPIEEATITRGGVALQEIDPQTMESRLVKGLYFCGEVIDIDGITGGYNLQEAFSTGWLAGESAVGNRSA